MWKKLKPYSLAIGAVIFEFIANALVIVLPLGNPLRNLILLAHLVIYFAVPIYIGRAIWFFKKSLIHEILSLAILGIGFIFTLSAEAQRTRIEFYLFRNQMEAIAKLGLQDALPFLEPRSPSDRDFRTIKVPNNFWWLSSGSTQLTKIDKGLFIFVVRSGFLFRRCGYLFSSQDISPNDIDFTDGTSAESVDFRRLKPNWFYGCFEYMG